MKPIAKAITQYPLLLDAVAIILINVIDGINHGNPVHMSLGYTSLLNCGKNVNHFLLKDLKDRLSDYKIIFSESAVSSSYIRLKQPKGTDIFEEGEFIYGCRSGSFHFRFDSNGALFDILSEFDGNTPGFIDQLVRDFPGNNYHPDIKILKSISFNGMINKNEFLSGLNPFHPVTIEVD